jgi:hypothetical protein
MSPSDDPDDAAENWQLKVDEVTALSAIFDEDFQYARRAIPPPAAADRLTTLLRSPQDSRPPGVVR